MMHGYCQQKARKERRGTTTKVMTGCKGATLGRVTQIVHHILTFNQARKNAQSSTTFANESTPIQILYSTFLKEVKVIGEEEIPNEPHKRSWWETHVFCGFGRRWTCYYPIFGRSKAPSSFCNTADEVYEVDPTSCDELCSRKPRCHDQGRNMDRRLCRSRDSVAHWTPSTSYPAVLVGPCCVVSSRFGLALSDKIRAIDDLSGSLVNSAYGSLTASASC